MRRMKASFSANVHGGVYQVVDGDKLAGEWTPTLRFLVLVRTTGDQEQAERLASIEAENVGWVVSDFLKDGDVVTAQVARSEAHVEHRLADIHHSLLLTNRCNSYCLMCSQPPTRQDDSWLAEQAIAVVRHMRTSPAVLGLSGGEPLLLGPDLRRVLTCIDEQHPETAVEILTNGRLLANETLASRILLDVPPTVSWLVPLYGHADYVHDFVVQTPGAFDETIAGLLTLQEHRQPIQLRIVLIEPVLRTLEELCAFVGRNLPFVREVALMACEPIGFALANRSQCAVDLRDWAEVLSQSTRILRRYRVPFLFMNAPLCALPRALWSSAHKSISDWKNVYPAECSKCLVRDQCSGLFAWHESGWQPTKIQAIEEDIT